MKGLTKRQTEILQLISAFIDKNGYSPSVRELAKALDCRSTSSIFKHLKSLEAKGFISQEKKKARSLEIVAPKEGGNNEKKVPIVGSISRGQKIEFFTKLLETAFPEHLLPKELKQYYGFFVKDSSFQESQLLQGDILAIDSKQDPENREVVLAQDKSGGALIGSFLKEKAGCRIGNEFFPENEVKILGVLAALQRSY